MLTEQQLAEGKRYWDSLTAEEKSAAKEWHKAAFALAQKAETRTSRPQAFAFIKQLFID